MKRATEMRQKMDSSIIIKAKTPTTPGSGCMPSPLSTEVMVDPKELAEEVLGSTPEDPNLELEGSFLGRGVSYYTSTLGNHTTRVRIRRNPNSRTAICSQKTSKWNESPQRRWSWWVRCPSPLQQKSSWRQV